VTRHPGRRRDHVLLRDAALDELVGIRELEGARAAVRREIGVEDDEVVALRSELEQRLAVCLDDVLVRDRAPHACARTGLRLTLEPANGALVLDRLERRGLEAERRAPFRETRLELRQRAGERLVAGRARMPAVRPSALGKGDGVLHERHAPALDRLGDERLRRTVGIAEPRERLSQRRVVVTVDRGDVPAERAELRLEVTERDDLLRRLVRLHLVAVDDHPQPAQALVRRSLERLPVLPLLELPVPRHDDDTPSAAEPALRERDPASLGDAHPERARARLDPRHADVGMTVEAAEAT